MQSYVRQLTVTQEKKTTANHIFNPEKNVLGETPEQAENTVIVAAAFTGFMETFLGHGKCVTDKRMGWCLMLGTITELTWAQVQVSARAVLRH